MKIEVSVKQRFRVPAPLQEVHDLLADVPRSARHFPNVERLADEGKGVYRWEMEPIKALGLKHQVVYACRYDSALKSGKTATVSWTPLPKVGNGQIEGRWRLAVENGGTQIEFETAGALEIPVPALFRPMAAPFVQGMFRDEVGRYLANIRRALGGA